MEYDFGVTVKKLHYSSDQDGGDMADLKAFKSEIHALTQIRHAILSSFMASVHLLRTHFRFMSLWKRGA